MSIISIDKIKITEENDARILELKELIPDLNRQIKALKTELKQLEQNNIFLSELKSDE